jgi:hypothetical protein
MTNVRRFENRIIREAGLDSLHDTTLGTILGFRIARHPGTLYFLDRCISPFRQNVIVQPRVVHSQPSSDAKAFVLARSVPQVFSQFAFRPPKLGTLRWLADNTQSP